MADELELTSTVSIVYVTIRDQNDSKVWNGSVFETWADGNIATYDVALTNRDGNMFQGDFPTAIDVGGYHITYYEQVGGAPATDDLVLFTEDLDWNGEETSTPAVGVTLNANALATLEETKRYKHIAQADTTEDDRLTQLINQASEAIITETGRDFHDTTYVDIEDVDDGIVLLGQFPVIQVNRVGSSPATGISVIYAGTDKRARVSVTDTAIVLTSTSAAGTTTTTELLFDDNVMQTAMATAITAVADWTGTQSGDEGFSSNLNRITGRSALAVTVNLEWFATDVEDWEVDYTIGSIDLSTCSCGDFFNHPNRVMVEYIAGYTSIPSDVSGVCIDLVSIAFDRSKGNTAVGSESLVDWSYSPIGLADLTANMKAVLANFKDYSKSIA